MGRKLEISSSEKAIGVQDEEIIRIFLNEYNTLRGEIVARMGHGFQIIGFSVAAYAFLANRAVLDLWFWIGTGLITILAALGIWFTIRDTIKAHDRLAEIELDINDRVGEDILVPDYASCSAEPVCVQKKNN